LLRVPRNVQRSKFSRRRDPAIKPSPSCNSMRCRPLGRRYQSDFVVYE
jgi:hypothetical protein